MEQAMKASGSSTKKATVEEGLRLIVRLKKQERIKEYKGKLKWEGNLAKMRTDL
jgi:Arc/MetJ family transcription regulator